MENPNEDFGLWIVKRFYDGIWGADHNTRLTEIGDQLYKVRKYADTHLIDDPFTKSIVDLTYCSYYAGLVPITRIESILFLAKEFRNEYGYAMALRAYIEVAGRLHKGVLLWKQFESKDKSLDEFREGLNRLMAKFQPKKSEPPSGYLKFRDRNEHEITGFNVMTLVDSLKDRIPAINEKYSSLSSYVHGDFEDHIFSRTESWFADAMVKDNPLISSYETDAILIRCIAFDDFDELLRITKPLRKRYDMFQRNEERNDSANEDI
jgi:hypothetical protein